jgi:tetratricopeptide (TPR) repeat protein
MRWFLLLAIGCCFATAPTVHAEEPTTAFLDGLRARQDFDLALEHIDKLEKNPDTPADVRASLNFERGVTLLLQSSREKSDSQKRAQRQAAVQALQKYLDQRPGGLKELQAQAQLGTAHIEQARHFMKNAEDSPEELQADLHAKGREQYAEALKVFEQIERSSTAQLQVPEVLADDKQKEEFRKQVLQGLLLIAATREEMAETYPNGSEEQQAAVEKAAGEYEAIAQAYRTRLAGLYARMYQGRCLQKLGKHPKALAAFGEILAIPDSPEPFRVLRFSVVELASDSWLATKDYETLFSRVQPILDNLRPDQEKSAEVATLRAKLATAKTLQEAQK